MVSLGPLSVLGRKIRFRDLEWVILEEAETSPSEVHPCVLWSLTDLFILTMDSWRAVCDWGLLQSRDGIKDWSTG